MCKANRKLEAFRYVLTKFVAYQMKLTSASSDKPMTRDETLSSFSNKRLMKLLYLLCLESISIEDEKGLFETFNNMIAYPNGPVEQDVYDGLGLIKGAKYEDGKLLSFDDNIDIRTEHHNKIDAAFDKLVNHLQDDDFCNTERLINIVHSLYLWPKTYVSSSDKLMDVNNKDELIKEKKAYEQLCQNSHK